MRFKRKVVKMEIGDILLKGMSADEHVSFKTVTSLMVQRGHEEVELHVSVCSFYTPVTHSWIYYISVFNLNQERSKML